MDIASLLTPKISTPSAGTTRGAVTPFSATNLLAQNIQSSNAAQGVQVSISAASAQQVAASTALAAAATQSSSSTPFNAKDNALNAFVAKPYYASQVGKANLNSALATDAFTQTQTTAPAEDAPRVNAQGQVTGLLLNERA